MEKEFDNLLEDLDSGEEVKTKYGVCYAYSPDIVEELKQALTELKQIKEAKPGEAVERLDYIEDKLGGLRAECERIKNHRCDDLFIQKHIFATVKQALLTAQEQNFSYQTIIIPFFDELAQLLGTNDIDEMLDKIKEQHNVLRIIKEKRVDQQLIRIADSVKWYNKEYIYRHEIEYLNRSILLAYQLTKEEFKTLKRRMSTNTIDMKRLNIEEE